MQNSLKQVAAIINKIKNNIYYDFGSTFTDTIFIGGTGRSGTTWLSDIINYDNEYRYIFEPFYPAKVDICKDFSYKQYLRPDNRSKIYVAPAQQILTGKIRNSWTDQYNSKIIAHKRLIKDIRANFLLRWLYKNFPGIKIILTLRHPCAVANSRIKLQWGTQLEEILANEALKEDYLHPFLHEIENTGSDFEKQIFLWCIENYVPLMQFKKGEIHLTFYENYCANPRNEIEDLFKFLNKKCDQTVYDALSNPSATIREDSAIQMKSDLINSWRKSITEEQVDKAVQILSLFGLDTIYSHESMPNVSSAFHFMNNRNL